MYIYKFGTRKYVSYILDWKKGWDSILDVSFNFSHQPADKHVHLRSFAARRNFAAHTRQGAT